MRGYFCLVNMLMLCMVQTIVHAQAIQGQISDFSTGKLLDGVIVQNVHTDARVLSDNGGKFSLTAGKGQLIEFSMEGYKVLRVRLPQGNIPAFFKVAMDKITSHPADPLAGTPKDYKTDSAKYGQLYKRELEFPQMSGLEKIQHPFSAMSKRNQEIWAFQKEYAWYQEQKYIDYTFNASVVEQLTGLRGDSAQQYLQMFRPTYTQLRNMNEYNYYNYIRKTVDAYRKRGIRAKSGPGRGTK